MIKTVGVMTTQQDIAWISNFLWGVADDILRDVYVRGKYRDVILPMTVLRRLDAVLEPSKSAVLAMRNNLDAEKIVNQEGALRKAAGQPTRKQSYLRVVKKSFGEKGKGSGPKPPTAQFSGFSFRKLDPR